MSFLRHVKQLEPDGSAVAVLAMLTRQDYRMVRADLGVARFSIIDVDSYLGKRGFAVLRRWVLSNVPPSPRDENQFAKVRTRTSSDHWVVVLPSGDVLDPDSAVIKRLTDYPHIFHVTSVHPVRP